MLSRTAHRLETSLLLSRQSLPRPARFPPPQRHQHRPARQYSTPSTPSRAPATATAQLPTHDFPAYMQPSTSSSGQSSSQKLGSSDILSPFLARLEYTILPTPLPTDEHKHDPVFVSTAVQDQIAVMDACLRDLYNVKRGKGLFERLRAENRAVLHTDIYNNVLSAYMGMAERTELSKPRQEWFVDAWTLFHSMVSGKEGIAPNSSTFARMIAGYHHLKDSLMDLSVPDRVPQPSYGAFLSMMERAHVDAVEVLANPLIPDEVAPTIVSEFSKAALDANKIDIVNELAKATVIASGQADTVPEAMATRKPLKDGSFADVPFNIKNLRDHLANVAFARQTLPDNIIDRQRHLELSAYTMEEGRMKAQHETLDQLGIDTRFRDKVLQEMMYGWHEKLKKRVAELVSQIEKEEAAGKYRLKPKAELAPYLALVQPERLSMITILEAMRLCGSGGVASGMKSTRALVSIGKAVEMEYKARVCRKNRIVIPDVSRPDTQDVFSSLGYSNLHERRLAAAKQMTAGESWTAPWSQTTRAQIGALLMEVLMQVATVPQTAVNEETGEVLTEEHPAFFHSYEYMRGTKLGVIKVNHAVSERIAKDVLKGTIHPRHLPMLHPPKPWVRANEGGYLYTKTPLMRYKECVEQEKYLHEAIRKGNMEAVMAGLNVLGRTPWKINKKIFDVVLTIWNSGEGVGKLPPAKLDEPEPQPPPEGENDVRARAIYLQHHKQWSQNVANNHSERCSTNYKIEIARAFLDETIYFPHNLDFRGRAYPLPPHLNHIGDDLSRGLLLFQEAKPLGERGLRWMKIHLANLYGFDKADFDERVHWVHDRLDDIKDSAKNPLTGRGWWKKADDPFQCLATCMELTEALESPDPLAYKSCLPVHQDGTCNGLQHYAAMGGDAQGAQQVNLAASDRPSDVYTFVGNKVDKLVNEDAAKGDRLAQLLQGKITRKVVKQTVMTTVYGVTFVGARDQIEGQLIDRGDIPLEECWNVAGYLAKKVLHCIGDTFHGARSIQNWLNLCARLISKSVSPDRFAQATEKYTKKKEAAKASKAKRKAAESEEAASVEVAPAVGKKTKNKTVDVAKLIKKEQMTSVIWTTALGLPVVQPYRKTSRKQIMTNIQSVFISDPNIPNEVNAVKQASAFPPNFVHSLDATHMLLSALECNNQKLTFASVHDSYWTHACDVDAMSEIIRDTFIELHSTDVLGRLYNEFKQRYKGYLIPAYYLQSQETLQHKLYEAGTRLKVRPGQNLAGLEKLIEVSESDSEVSTVKEENLLGPSATKEEVVKAAEELAASDAEEEGGGRGAKKPIPNPELVNKFLDVTELFPPLPEKGSFNVADIRKSAYFFS